MKEGQEYCVRNKYPWLAASLLGVSNSFYSITTDETRERERERGVDGEDNGDEMDEEKSYNDISRITR
jgi:hypothetical protein